MNTRFGIYEGMAPTFHSMGEQKTTIDGQEFLTWFDILDARLKGLQPGCRVEYEFRPGPTVLCDSPHLTDPRPYARLLRVVADGE
ncbi:MAG: hypothetical protein WCS94_23965 [Verrucomicrobiota bacterium]